MVAVSSQSRQQNGKLRLLIKQRCDVDEEMLNIFCMSANRFNDLMHFISPYIKDCKSHCFLVAMTQVWFSKRGGWITLVGVRGAPPHQKLQVKDVFWISASTYKDLLTYIL